MKLLSLLPPKKHRISHEWNYIYHRTLCSRDFANKYKQLEKPLRVLCQHSNYGLKTGIFAEAKLAGLSFKRSSPEGVSPASGSPGPLPGADPAGGTMQRIESSTNMILEQGANFVNSPVWCFLRCHGDPSG